MQNEVSFGVEFTREKIESILKDPGVTRIIVSGKYSYNGKDGWEMHATVDGSPTNKSLAGRPLPDRARRNGPGRRGSQGVLAPARQEEVTKTNFA